MENKEKCSAVRITLVQACSGTVTVKGTADGLGARRVEVIVNGDLNKRYVAKNDASGAWECRFALSCDGGYSIEASIRDYSDFNRIRQATPDENYVLLEGVSVWGSTVVRHTDGLYYMIFAMWERHDGFSPDWYHYSELGYAVSTKSGGPYVYQGKALDASYCNTTHEKPVHWHGVPLDVFHNPSLLHSARDGKYYLYFMGTSNAEPDKSHGRQRVGVAYADSPAGPWTVVDKPVFDTRETWDWSMTSNPSVTEVKQDDGSYLYYAVHKGSGTYEGQRLTATGYGTSASPLGPFQRSDAPIMRDPEVGFSVEDCYVWRHNDRYYALAKDMTKGNWTGVYGVYSYALFESTDGTDWSLSANKLAFQNEIPWWSGTQVVSFLERSQLYIEDTVPFLITNATTVNGKSPYEGNQSYNVQIPLLGVALATDTYTLDVNGLDEGYVDKSALRAVLEEARLIKLDALAAESRRMLKSAMRAADIVVARACAEQWDVDFVTERLQALLA